MPTLVKNQTSDLETLISELLKDRPNKEKVKDLMSRSGLEYSADPIEQMSSVLTLLQSSPGKFKKEKVQEV